MSKYVITGGAGFIGSHIVEELLKKGESVVVLDNFSSGKEENLTFVSNYSLDANRYTLIRGDICDYETCVKACQGADYVLHQAALRSVPKSMEAPHDYNKVNIDGTLNILEAAKENNVKRVVIASSSSVISENLNTGPSIQTYLSLIWQCPHFPTPHFILRSRSTYMFSGNILNFSSSIITNLYMIGGPQIITLVSGDKVSISLKSSVITPTFPFHFSSVLSTISIYSLPSAILQSSRSS